MSQKANFSWFARIALFLNRTALTLLAGILSGSMYAQSSPAANKPVIAIEAVKMNVFYIGVDNPLRIAATAVPANDLEVQLLGKGTIDGGNGQYTVRVTEPGEVTVRVTQKAKGQNNVISDQKFRVKRIPDPSPWLSGKGGPITKETLLSKTSVLAMMENFDFDVVCQVIGYELTVLPKGQEPYTFNVKGADIPSQAKAAFEKLSGDGDAIFFDNIQAKCQGDEEPRKLDGMSFKLKPRA